MAADHATDAHVTAATATLVMIDVGAGTYSWQGRPGVSQCDGQGRVEYLELGGQVPATVEYGCARLTGTVVPCLSALRGLRYLDLHGTGVSGAVPADLGLARPGFLFLMDTQVDLASCRAYATTQPQLDCHCP